MTTEITDFIARVTAQDGVDFVAVEQRIAVFEVCHPRFYRPSKELVYQTRVSVSRSELTHCAG